MAQSSRKWSILVAICVNTYIRANLASYWHMYFYPSGVSSVSFSWYFGERGGEITWHLYKNWCSYRDLFQMTITTIVIRKLQKFIDYPLSPRRLEMIRRTYTRTSVRTHAPTPLPHTHTHTHINIYIYIHAGTLRSRSPLTRQGECKLACIHVPSNT